MSKFREEFLKYIVTKTGTLSSNAMRKEYFEKRNLLHLWNWFLEETELYSDWTIQQRAFVLRADKHRERPLCRVCNENKIGFLNRSISEYCSKQCCSRDNKNLGTGWKDKKTGIEKRKKTNLQKYGVEHHTQREEWRSQTKERMSKIQVSEESLILLNNKDWLYENYVALSRSVYDIAEQLNVHYGTVFVRIDQFEIPRQYYVSSIGQREVYSFIQDELGIPAKLDVIGKLHGKYHIDIFVESHKFGVEYNGLFHHSAGCLEQIVHKRDYHLNKTLAALDNGIDLLHITDQQWKEKKDIVKSMIRNKLGKSTRIMARKTKIVSVDSKQAHKFFDETHIQGFVGANQYVGLEYNGELVSLMSFAKPRFNKKYDFELIRFSNKLNTSVVGGFSKILSHFKKENNNPSIISYADRSRSTGNVYEKNGFTLSKTTEPGYGYTDGERLYNRQKFQKHKLKDLLNIYDENLSEEDNMFNNKYRKYFDCGQLVYVLGKQ